MIISFFDDDEPSGTIMVSNGCSCAEVRQRWQEISGQFGPVDLKIDSPIGPALPMEGSIAELYPLRKFLLIHVLRGTDKVVRIVGSQRESLTIKLRLEETTQKLTSRVKSLLGVDEAREARLLVGGRVLDPEVLPCAQLAGCPIIDLDLQCHFLACYLDSASGQSNSRKESQSRDNPMTSALGVDLRPLRVFASEPIRALAGRGEWRAVGWNGAKLSSDEAVCGLIAEEVLRSGGVTGVTLERRMEVWLEEKMQQRSRTAVVWPSTKLGELRSDPKECVLIDREMADPDQKIWESGLAEGNCLTVTRFESISIYDEKGSCRTVTADLSEPLQLFRKQAALPKEAFEFWNAGQKLETEKSSLHDLKIDETSCILIFSKTKSVVLRSHGKDLARLDSIRKDISFKSFLVVASEALKTQLSPKTLFICECGRVFSDESTQRREFPRQCCSCDELRLTIEGPSRGESFLFPCSSFRSKPAWLQSVTLRFLQMQELKRSGD